MPGQRAPSGLLVLPSILVLLTLEKKRCHSPGTNHSEIKMVTPLSASMVYSYSLYLPAKCELVRGHRFVYPV